MVLGVIVIPARGISTSTFDNKGMRGKSGNRNLRLKTIVMCKQEKS